MDKTAIQQFFEDGLLTPEKKNQLDALADRSVFSMYYELRTMLYIGVLLLSGGVGVLIYNNLGQAGHYMALVVLSASTMGCFYYVHRHRLPFSNAYTETANPYFDYALLLGCLFFISVLGYLQFLFGWFTNHISLISLTAAILYFFMAYRHDHLGVLSLGITAMAAFLGLAFSPMKWYEFNFPADKSAQWVAMNYGVVIFFGALVLERMKIKAHFTKTYLNFGVIIALSGSTAMLFQSGDTNYFMAFAQVLATALLAWYSYRQRTVLYIIYAYIFGFIALTYMLANALEMYEIEFWLLYIIGVCAGFISSILIVRNAFKHDI